MDKRKTAKKQIKPPKLPKHGLENGLPDSSLLDRAYYSQLLLSHNDLANQVAERVSFDQIIFQQVHLDKTILKKMQVLDSQFVICDFANAEWPEAAFSRVEIVGCHLTGLLCGEAQFRDVLFKDCHGSFAQFAFSTFQSVRFEGCNLSEANFLKVDLSSVTFENCDLRLADFTEARLDGVDLRSSQIDGIRVSPDGLKGAIINPAQALAFIRSLGILVMAADNSQQE